MIFFFFPSEIDSFLFSSFLEWLIIVCHFWFRKCAPDILSLFDGIKRIFRLFINPLWTLFEIPFYFINCSLSIFTKLALLDNLALFESELSKIQNGSFNIAWIEFLINNWIIIKFGFEKFLIAKCNVNFPVLLYLKLISAMQAMLVLIFRFTFKLWLWVSYDTGSSFTKIIIIYFEI